MPFVYPPLNIVIINNYIIFINIIKRKERQRKEGKTVGLAVEEDPEVAAIDKSQSLDKEVAEGDSDDKHKNFAFHIT